MLSVQPPTLIERNQISMDSNSLSQTYEAPITNRTKQLQKKQFITPTTVIIGVAILCILVVGTYQLYTIVFPAPSNSKINQSFTKITQNAESSSGRGDTNSNTGSQGSRPQKDSSTPIGVATTVRKDIISSNMGTGSGDDDDDEPSQKKNDGDRRNNHLKKNRIDGSSTENDSDQSDDVEEDSQHDNAGQVNLYPNNGEANLPLVGDQMNP